MEKSESRKQKSTSQKESQKCLDADKSTQELIPQEVCVS